MQHNKQGQQSSAPTYKLGDLLDEKEAARYLKVAGSTLRNWRATKPKQGPVAVKIGRRAVRYRFSDLEAFIVASTAEAA